LLPFAPAPKMVASQSWKEPGRKPLIAMDGGYMVANDREGYKILTITNLFILGSRILLDFVEK